VTLRFATAVVLVAALAPAVSAAGDREAGPPPRSADPALLDLDLERYRDSQRAGFWLFGGGLVVELAGVVLTQIDPWGSIGISGFVTIGAGIAVVTAGMLTLAASRWRWQRTVRGVAAWRGSAIVPGGGREPG
jgi:hypothetical protein